MNKKMTYEQAIKRLEEIANKMEDGTVLLEESISLFEEATGLSLLCNQYLNEAEQKIIELSKET